MGKKVNKRADRNVQKEKQLSTSSPKNVPQKTIPTVIVGVPVEKEARVCPHLKTGINLDKITSKITSFESLTCDDCREVVVDKRASKVKGKNKKKGGNSISESKSIWLCLACGHFTCGGVGFPTTPNSHATRHAKQKHHPLVIQFANPNLRWCFSCNTLIPVQTSENGEYKDDLSNIVKLLKPQPLLEKSLDVEDVWFGSGSVLNEIKSVNSSSSSEHNSGYKVKGLLNLGNTCFFNSILQNLLAMEKLRDHFLKFEKPDGTLTVTLKKLFVESISSTSAKNVFNPRPLFNSVCVTAPQFKGYQQQDSHELLRFLLDGLCNEESGIQNCVPKQSRTFVDTMFGGQTSSSVCCLECGHTSIVYEPYLDLSLPLPTRKSSSKIPTVSRLKKIKPPQVRRGNFSRRIYDVAATSSAVSDSSLAENNVTEKMSEITIKESGIFSDNLALVCYVEPNSNSNPTVDSSNSSLDHLEPTMVSSDRNAASCNGDDAVAELACDGDDAVAELACDGDDVVAELADDSWLDYLSLSNDHNMVSQNDDSSVVQNSGNSNDVLWEDELLLQVQDSEIIILPYEKLISTSNGNEVTSSSVGYEQEPSDFDGFGGLFDEPEVVSKPTVGPLSNGDINDSDSDSYEVDNSDSPLSVEKCLSYFTTSEILTKTEHAWHCEQCSKSLLEQKTRLKNKLHEPISNGGENGILNISSDSSIEHTFSNELQNDKRVVNGDQSSDSVSSEESCTVQVADSCHVNEPDDKCKDEKVEKNGLNGVEEDEVDSSNVKVIRDASKRILINRVPPILTIHLKRLSQDARGLLSKLNGHVDFQDIIDLEPYMDPSCKDKEVYKYRLIGVVEHIGSMREGHYVAYVRGGKKGNNNDCFWYHASDAHVREVSFEEVLRCEAYILFYEQM